MTLKVKLRRKEFGDFQTPPKLAALVISWLKKRGINPISIIEPTCGLGNFVKTAINEFDWLREIFALDINESYIETLKKTIEHSNIKINIEIGDFFKTDWLKVISGLQEPILVLGNPPWVTNAELGAIGSNNIPIKSNVYRYKGYGAKTGKSNFDISEWMLICILNAINRRNAVMAMLCKTAVARKVLKFAKDNNITICDSFICKVDAETFFNASVDACLFVCILSREGNNYDCNVYNDLHKLVPTFTIGYRDNMLLSDITEYERLKELQGGNHYTWRSGIKHDASKVMELSKMGEYYVNGFGNKIKLEETLLYPLVKSSDLTRGRISPPQHWLIVTQNYMGQNTEYIRDIAPLTWKYLEKNKHVFLKRASSIYRDKPIYSLFGIGDYSFSDWKVAISGFYKKLHFRKIGKYDNKPYVLDDTCYFISCSSEEEADIIEGLLNTKLASEFYETFIFWDNKRPITKEILQRLNIILLAKKLDKKDVIDGLSKFNVGKNLSISL